MAKVFQIKVGKHQTGIIGEPIPELSNPKLDSKILLDKNKYN
jgi:hypothetical protein